MAAGGKLVGIDNFAIDTQSQLKDYFESKKQLKPKNVCLKESRKPKYTGNEPLGFRCVCDSTTTQV
jgi:hypothetical protein